MPKALRRDLQIIEVDSSLAATRDELFTIDPTTSLPYENPFQIAFPKHFGFNESDIDLYDPEDEALEQRIRHLDQEFMKKARAHDIGADVELCNTKRPEMSPLFFRISIATEDKHRAAEAYHMLLGLIRKWFPNEDEFPGLHLRKPVIRCMLAPKVWSPCL